MLNLNIVNSQLWITTSTSSKVAPGQKVCHPTLRCHNLSTRVFWVLQLTNFFVAAQTLIRFLVVKIGGLLKHIFLDPTRPGRPRLCAGDTCHWNMCHHTMHSINSGHQSFAQKEIFHWNNKFQTFFKQSLWVLSLNLRMSNRIPTFKYHSFSISDFNSWASLRFSCSLYKWNSREKMSEKGCYQQDPLDKSSRTNTGIEGVLGAEKDIVIPSATSIAWFTCVQNHFKCIPNLQYLRNTCLAKGSRIAP